MKTRMVLLLTAVVALGAMPIVGAAHGDAHGKPVTLTGEIIDLQCYIQHPESAVGMDHAKCAQACMSRGLPIGFLADDGTVYTLIGPEHEPVVDVAKTWAGKKCALTGTVIEHNGIKAIQLASVAAAPAAGAAVSYTCPMHPDVHQKEPGKCPKCGMTLEPEKTD